MNGRIREYWNYFIDLIFPRICYGCSRKIIEQEREILCTDCESLLEFRTGDICRICGSDLINKRCSHCETGDILFDKARSVYPFNSIIRNVIHSLKYEEKAKIGKYLGELAADYLRMNNDLSPIDLIIPVPLHKVKKRARGYNQSYFISKTIADRLNTEHSSDLVMRTKFTKTQTRLSRTERHKNVSEAFKFNSEMRIDGLSILIIDDVFTTGSTVNSISRLLREHNAKKVFVLTIARA